jgi:lipid-A-disaccharide synthase
MGFSEVVLRLRELLSLRKQVQEYFLKNPPDIFVGIDAPDFNLPIELVLKQAGILTVHCNSPTIWAWRYKRIFKIGRAINLMLTLFPFEARYYEEVKIPVRYIGHPLADLIPLQSDQKAARQVLQLPLEARIVALLPGSRFGEIKYIGPVLLQAAQRCLEKYPDLIFISPMINAERAAQFRQQWQMLAPQLPLMIIDGQSRIAMTAADVITLASGTATLEALLIKRPMVVTYRSSMFSFFIAKQLIKIKQYSLPNILAGEELVPEFIQQQATAENIAQATLAYFDNTEKVAVLVRRFTDIHLQLRCNANNRAAEAMMKLLSQH